MQAVQPILVGRASGVGKEGAGGEGSADDKKERGLRAEGALVALR
jgi:hypothetical protein